MDENQAADIIDILGRIADAVEGLAKHQGWIPKAERPPEAPPPLPGGPPMHPMDPMPPRRDLKK